MKQMKYLESKIDPMTKNENELQLCIQCDLDIFEWLIKYIHSNQKVVYNCSEMKEQQSVGESQQSNQTNQDAVFENLTTSNSDSAADTSMLELNQSNIIKLLIPADFLQIESLKSECISYIGINIEAITKMKINMSFLSPQTLAKLAFEIDVEVLDGLRERKDKFITKLFD